MTEQEQLDNAIKAFQQQRNEHTATNVYLIIENTEEQSLLPIKIWTDNKALTKAKFGAFSELTDSLVRAFRTHWDNLKKK